MTTAGWLGRQTVALQTCASTNDEALRLARAGAEHGTVVVADTQTAGRGRLGRSWTSLPGNLLVSMILRPPQSDGIARYAALPLVVGLAVARTLQHLGVPAKLKWPNDVGVVRGASFVKVGGILAESIGGTEPAIVVGIGVNLTAAPDELSASTSSVARETKTAVPDRDVVLAQLLIELESWLAVFADGGVAAIIEPWQLHMAPIARLRTTSGSGVASVEGQPLGLAVDGALRLRDDSGCVHQILSGELEIVA